MRAVLEAARDEVAELLGVTSRQVVFTSGATEAVNAAVWGATRAAPGAPVLCAAVEHSAVRDAVRPCGTGRGAAGRRHRSDRRGRTAGPSRGVVTAAAGLGALPMGQPRGGHPPTRRRGGGAVPGGGGGGPRRRRRRLRARPDRPGRPGRRPGERQRAQARRRAGRGALVVRRGEPLRTAAGRRRAGTRAPGRSGSGPRPDGVRRRCGRAGGGEGMGPRGRGGPWPGTQIAALLDAALSVEGVELVGPVAPPGPAPPPGLPGGARGRGGAGADRARPGRRGRPLRVGLLLGEHRALTGARGDGRRSQPLPADQRGLVRPPRRTAPPSPVRSHGWSANCGPSGPEPARDPIRAPRRVGPGP